MKYLLIILLSFGSAYGQTAQDVDWFKWTQPANQKMWKIVLDSLSDDLNLDIRMFNPQVLTGQDSLTQCPFLTYSPKPDTIPEIAQPMLALPGFTYYVKIYAPKAVTTCITYRLGIYTW